MLGWELPPHNSGGLGVACYQLCKALAKKGADIEFVVPYDAHHNINFMKVTAAQPNGVHIAPGKNAYESHVYTYPDGRTETIDIFGQQQYYEKAVTMLTQNRAQEFDVIHAHDWLTFRAALRAKEQTGLPLVIHLHSIERDRAGGNAGNPLVREIESIALLMADRIIAVSQHTKNMIVEDYDIPGDKIEVVHNSIDPEMFEPLDSSNSYVYLAELKKQGWRMVVNLGRLTVQKNLVNLLYAAKEVVARAPKTMFVFVGSGDQYFELITLAADLGIAKNVTFVGFQRGKRWRDSYAIADLFVMPSISEPFGLTALEAIGYGAPVLMSKQSGVAEILTNGLKVNFWDVHDMADKITAVVCNDSLRDELLQNAQAEYRRLNWDRAADTLFGIYHHHKQKKALPV